ncbi:MAG TPA: S41 family peptidase [Candidatus Nanopelagicales bacterium]|nr:S41 family peptidase [Candidatus Nanopelagicales bacterium]
MTDLLDRDPEAAAPSDTAPPPVPVPARRRGVAPLQLALATVALLAGAALFLSGFSLGARTATTPGTPAADAELFAPFWDAYESITKSYVGDVDREKLVQGAIDGMIGALDDPYSSYMSPEELQRARESIGGEFSGVGAEVTTRPTDPASETCATIGPACRLVVVAPIDGSPAERAGLRSGDVITAVDGRSVDGETLDEAIARIRGPKGTEVVLAVVRDDGAPFEVAIVRDTIVSRQVETRELAGGSVTYVRVAGFSDNAARQFESAIRAARDTGVTKFVVDLRDNPGGYVTAARSIASQFIGEGPLFWEEAADGTQVATNAERGGAATGAEIRMAVLVNGGSASASEIVAGALQDTGRGTLVGEKTFGKGTIQQWVDLTAESGGFRLTIAKWLTPDKRWIHQEGLQPDVALPAGGAGTGEPGPTGDPYIDAALEVLDAAARLPGVLRAA